MDKSLKLSEKLFCLAVNPKKGGIIINASATLNMTLTGTVFVELMKRNLIFIKKGFIHVASSGITNDEIYEFFLKPVRVRKRGRKIRAWISWFSARGRKIQKLFIRNLVQKGILKLEEKRFLFIPYSKICLSDSELVEDIRKEIEIALLNANQPTEESVILAMMVAKTNLMRRVFPARLQRREANRNLKKLPETQVSKAVQDAIQMMQASVYAVAT